MEGQKMITPKYNITNFWALYWGRRRYSPEDWLNFLTAFWSNKVEAYNPHRDLLIKAIHKVYYEKLITREEAENLTERLDSELDEDKLMVITILAQLKPTKFKKYEDHK